MARLPAPDTLASERELAKDNARTLLVALQRLAFDCGRPPTEREGLVSLIHNPGLTNWKGPYVFELKSDPWGRSFRYAPGENMLGVGSDGPDRVRGTVDDIVCKANVSAETRTNAGTYKVTIRP